MAEEKWVTWDGLKYYDTKVKSHIDSKLTDLQNDVPSKEQFDNLQEVVTNIVKEQTDVTARVDSLQDHIDENEAAIEDLRKFDLQVASDIAALQTHMEYTVKKEDLNGYATQEFVTDAIRSAELSKDVDLSDYYKKGDVDALVNDVRINVAKNETAIAGLATKIDDVKSDVTRNHELIEELLVSVENKADEVHQHHLSDIIDYDAPDLTNYATKDDLKDAIDNLLIPDFDDYYTKSEIDKMIPEIDNLVTKQELEVLTNAVGAVEESLEEKADKTELDGLASEEFVLKKIAEAELGDQDVDLSAYYTKSETEEKIKEAVDAIDVPDVSSLATKKDLEDVQNVAGSNSVKLFAIESDLVDMSNELENIPTTYATKEKVAAVEAKVDAIVIPETDLSNYYNKSETENLIAEAVKDIEHPTVDLEGYATEEWVNSQGFLKEHQDLSDYAKKSDIPQPELFVIDYNAPNFVAAFEAYNNGKLLLLTNAAPDGNGYAVMNYVRDDMITFTKFLMSRSETYGAFNTYYLHSDNSWEVSKEVKLNKVDAIVDENQDITGLTIGKNTYDFDNFATIEEVNQLNENIENNYVSNTTLEEKNYVTEQHITQNYITIQDAADTYVTTEAVTEVVETQVNEVVTKEIETKVETIIQEKVDAGEIEVSANKIAYGDF